MSKAADQFEQYYAEKLWETIPAIYRHEDGIADEPGVLRAIVQVIAQQAAILRRSQDHLWNDQFIELCDEWAVPYIGDLVATRLLSALNKRGRRIDVAKTIYYRRRKGTPRILEELIADISGWEGKLVEQFQKLARARHGLDPHPVPLGGRYSGTLPGGWADIRNQRISELAGGAFEEYFHTPDMRRNKGLDGRYAIPKIAFYLYRLRVFQATGITPFSLGDGLRFTFDPSGRDIPLFSKSLRSFDADWDWEDWHSAFEWELPAPIPCRLLAHAEYSFGEEIIQSLVTGGLSIPAADELRQLSGLRFKNEVTMTNILDTFTNKAEILNPVNFMPLLALALVADCGKRVLLPDAGTILTNIKETSSIIVGFESPASTIVNTEFITAANLLSWSVASAKDLVIDAENGRFMFISTAVHRERPQVAYSYGFSAPTGAGNYDRPSLKEALTVLRGGGAITAANLNGSPVQIDDNKTYGPVADNLNIKEFIFQADNKMRPYLRLEADWVLSSGANINSTLTLDGLWIGTAGDVNAAVILKGNYECVTIRNCTLDPGGSKNAKNENLFPLMLVVDGFVETLCIASSILGPVKLTAAGNIEDICITDSILQSVGAPVKALEIGKGKTSISRSTIFGQVDVHRLEATEVIITDITNVTDTQNGCFRFSAAPVMSRLPRPYESFLFTEDTNHWFTSRRFGDPGFAQLSSTAPEGVLSGAENGSETGAFSALLNPIKMDGLRAKVDEYMPFGLIPIFINKT